MNILNFIQGSLNFEGIKNPQFKANVNGLGKIGTVGLVSCDDFFCTLF